MTVPSTRFREDYAGNGSATSFPYAFRIFKAADLVVTKTDSSGTDTTLTLGTDYTVTGAGSYNGGAVVLSTALPTSYRLTIERVLSIKQETDLRNQGEFLAETHEDAFDRLTMIVQRLAGYLGMGQGGTLRTLLLGTSDRDGSGAFRARGNRISGLGDPTADQDAATKKWALTQIAASMFDGVGNALLQLLASKEESSGSDMIGYSPEGEDAVGTTLQQKARETKSLLDWMSDDLKAIARSGEYTAGARTAMYEAVTAAWNSARALEHDLYAPAGRYEIGEYNFPWRNDGGTELLDGKNVTIYGDGPATIFATHSTLGADVFQTHCLKNFHARNLGIEATLTSDDGAGSNGISVTGGWDNLSFLDIWVTNLPYVDKGDYLDGGKALSIQPATPTAECGTLKARIFSKGNVYTIGLEVDLANYATKKHAIDVDFVSENCYQSVVFSAGGATASLSAGMTMGFSVRGQSINCQQDVVLSRAHGVDVDVQVVTNKSAAARRLNPSGQPWSTSDSVVLALIAAYAKNSKISVCGDKGACDYKARIGGATAGASGLGGQSDDCKIYIDVGGTAATADVDHVDSGGNSISNSLIHITTSTTYASLPAGFYLPSRNNTIIKSSAHRFSNPVISGQLNFSYLDGITSYHAIGQAGGELFAKQTLGGSVDLPIMSFIGNAGARKFSIRNDGAIMTAGRGIASAIGPLKGVLAVYDEDNNLWAYIPAHASYTP